MLGLLTPDDLSFLVQAAQRAAMMALQMQSTAASRDKGDGTVVTEADLQVERLLRHDLGGRFPGLPILGEEEGRTGGQADLVFALDPIDGTLSYARGDAHWAVSMGLLRDGRPVAGVVVAPALGTTWWAALGLGAYRAGRRLTRAGTHLHHHSLIGFTTSALTKYGPPPAELGHVRCFGGIALQLALCADNRLDAAVTRYWSVWDLAGATAVLLEAGGMLLTADGDEVTDLFACPKDADFITGGPNLKDLAPVPLPRWSGAGP